MAYLAKWWVCSVRGYGGSGCKEVGCGVLLSLFKEKRNVTERDM